MSAARSGRRGALPPPDDANTDPDAVLRSRFSLAPPPITEPPAAHPVPASTSPIPNPYPGMGRYGPGADAGSRSSAPSGGARRGSRPDAAGMRRVSYYITTDAAEQLDEAVTRVTQALGGDLPKHVALSALIAAAAAAADRVAEDLASARAHELADQLAQLRRGTHGS